MEDEILDAKREMIKLMEESGLDRRMMTLPTTSTIVNVFSGDLRDWFAGQALAGLCADPDVSSAAKTAELAYVISDAMLAARGAKK